MPAFPIGRIARARKEAAKKVAARIARFLNLAPKPTAIADNAPVENMGKSKGAALIVPLNPGFFHLERIREATVAKGRAVREQRTPQGR